MRKTAGVTFVELLVVVIVIGILAAVAVMRQRTITSRARGAAAVAACRSGPPAMRLRARRAREAARKESRVSSASKLARRRRHPSEIRSAE